MPKRFLSVMNEQPIQIDNISFTVTENLGNKGLLTGDPAFQPVNTFIGLVNDPAYMPAIADALQQQKNFSIQGFSFYKATGNELSTGLAFWMQYAKAIAQEPIYVLNQAWNPEPCYVPHATLVKVASYAHRLKTESKVTDPTWLFRKFPLAEYPNMTSNLLFSEKQTIRQLDHKLAEYRLKANDQAETIPSLLRSELAESGLLSTQQKTMKLYWLEQWGCSNLLQFYNLYLQNPTIEEPTESPNPAVNDAVLKQLDKQLKEALDMSTDTDEAAIAANKRFLFLDLDYYGFFDLNLYKEWLAFLENQSFVDLTAYYRNIVRLLDYYQSDERQQIFGTLATDQVVDLPFALEWFNQNPTAEFAWMASVESVFINAHATAAGSVFSRLNGQRIRLDVAREDGIHLRIMNAKFT
ncbi:hypothetical protein [Spirosoma pollinicola]|uniref:Uncharacterized protein n=1 Tax=Spirosoma pollinicola TaxID=2057025 RepID=A0A2K8Z4X6_9BACT|nr:hypothetical protein [Spirosoma pollinicola]AUD04879.1 hypothetical protein CWM47_25360 [Spirosoma pollinicola]